MKKRHDPQQKSLVGFVVGEVTYALAVGAVREVTSPLPVVPVPSAPPEVLGVADYRGAVIAVVDLRARFGLPKVAPTRRTKWIVVEASPSRLTALVVDAVTEVFGTGVAGVRQAPVLGPAEAARGVTGVVSAPSGLALVLDEEPFSELARSATHHKSVPPPPTRG